MKKSIKVLALWAVVAGFAMLAPACSDAPFIEPQTTSSSSDDTQNDDEPTEDETPD